MEYAEKAEKISLKDKILAKAYNFKGLIYWRQGNYPEALKYHLQSLELRQKIHDENGISSCYNNIGIIYIHQGNYPEALKYHLKSLEIKQIIHDEYGMSSSFNNIGVIYKAQGNYPEALNYHLKSLEIRQNFQDSYGIATSYNNIRDIYFNQGNYPEALNYQMKSLEISQNIANKDGIADSLYGLAEIYLKTDDTESAKEYVLGAASINKELQSKVLKILEVKLNGKIFISEEKHNDAVASFKQALSLAKQAGREDDEKELLQLSSGAYEKAGDAANALKYHKLYVEKEKKIFSEENNRYIASVKFTAELEQQKKQAEIEQLKNVELKKAYEDLQAAQEELIRKERMAAIGKIASEIAHEVQNPLNFVNNFSETNVELSEELKETINSNKLNEEEREALKTLINNSLTINQHGKRAAGIVSQLLELTRRG